MAKEAQTVSEELQAAMGELARDVKDTVEHIRSGFNRNHEVLSKVRTAADVVGGQFTELEQFCDHLLGPIGDNSSRGEGINAPGADVSNADASAAVSKPADGDRR